MFIMHTLKKHFINMLEYQWPTLLISPLPNWLQVEKFNLYRVPKYTKGYHYHKKVLLPISKDSSMRGESSIFSSKDGI